MPGSYFIMCNGVPMAIHNFPLSLSIWTVMRNIMGAFTAMSFAIKERKGWHITQTVQGSRQTSHCASHFSAALFCLKAAERSKMNSSVQCTDRGSKIASLAEACDKSDDLSLMKRHTRLMRIWGSLMFLADRSMLRAGQMMLKAIYKKKEQTKIKDILSAPSSGIWCRNMMALLKRFVIMIRKSIRIIIGWREGGSYLKTSIS